MEELIKEAKWLYFQIENTQENLVKSRLRNEKDNEHTALMELETEMCATLQLLKCIIERKDNIVDLGEVWHSVDEEPTCGEKLLHDNNRLGWSVRAWNGVFPWRKHVKLYGLTKWAYLKDLLPKGGEAWNTTK